MTELTESLTSAPTETLVVSQAGSAKPPSFTELIYAHYAWWRELRGDGVTAATQTHYDQLRDGFEREHGPIVRAYWCSHVESAVALTEQKVRFGGPRFSFYRESALGDARPARHRERDVPLRRARRPRDHRPDRRAPAHLHEPRHGLRAST